ncbi:MAG: hypothetical protein HQK56_01500 [Deltaproteobacteria bacterium]|nr:hypothetical protein [Deltaproteobacteria bacterium]
MKVGYSVEGSTDRAFLRGLRDRWCLEATLLEGRFRGQSGQSQRREIPNTCLELTSKSVDLIIFMRDANNEDWQEVLKGDSNRCREEHRHLVVFAVCDRNIECWLCADRDFIAGWTNRKPDDFDQPDPKKTFEQALGLSARTRGEKEPEIASLVCKAPLKHWLSNKSFEAFYEELRRQSKRLACQIENLRER